MLKLIKHLFKRIHEWLFWQPSKKSWCVMFYLTSQIPRSSYAINYVDPETGVPVGSLSDAKLDQILNDPLAGTKNLPCATAAGISSNPGWEDVHVGYRAIWDDVSQDVNGNLVKPPVAAIVSPDSSASSTSIFAGVPGEIGLDATLTADVTESFNWVYDKCPLNRLYDRAVRSGKSSARASGVQAVADVSANAMGDDSPIGLSPSCSWPKTSGQVSTWCWRLTPGSNRLTAWNLLCSPFTPFANIPEPRKVMRAPADPGGRGALGLESESRSWTT
jgi:hypothetical protein